MTYVKLHDPWADADTADGGGDESTPLNAAALDYIEEGIQDAWDAAEAAQADADTAQTTADNAASIALIIALG